MAEKQVLGEPQALNHLDIYDGVLERHQKTEELNADKCIKSIQAQLSQTGYLFQLNFFSCKEITKHVIKVYEHVTEIH